MISVKTFISTIKPAVADCLWVKPTSNGFELILIEAGQEKQLKIANAKSENNEKNLIGSVQDEKNANTINGAKAYAKDLKNALVGNPGDTAVDLTLYGLRTLIEERTAKTTRNYGNKNKQEE